MGGRLVARQVGRHLRIYIGRLKKLVYIKRHQKKLVPIKFVEKR